MVANVKDHHPEWRLTDEGRTVQVNLTSHFAGNKVTRLDFELAEVMNEQYERTTQSFRMFPRFTDSQWASIKIATGVFVLGTVMWRISTSTGYEVKEPQRIFPGPLPEDNLKLTLPRTQAETFATTTRLAVNNRRSYFEKRPEVSPVPGL